MRDSTFWRVARVAGLAVVIAGCAAPPQARSAGNLLTIDQWDENLTFVATSIKDHHPDPFAYAPESSFDEQIEQLRDQLPALDDHQVLVELMAAVAALEDGHTAIRGGISFLSGRYPFDLHAFSDGLHVTSANTAHQSLIGARLVSIGGVPAEEALARVANITPHENEMTILARAPAFLSIPEVLDALGMASSARRAEYVFRHGEAEEETIVASPVPFEEDLYWQGDAEQAERPLRRQRRGRNYWSEHLAHPDILYVQFNSVRDDERQSVEEFASEVEALESMAKPRCVFLDLRDNGGGNGYLNEPLVDWAARSPTAAQGRFYVGIGRQTFSAAQKLATSLEGETNVVFIGEPSGSRPNHFGDSESYELPHGDLTLSVSSIYWEDAGEHDDRDALHPDVLVRETSTDWLTWSDPVLQALESRCR